MYNLNNELVEQTFPNRGLWKFSVWFFYGCLIILMVCNWMDMYGYLDLLYTRIIRGFLLTLMIFCVLESSIRWRVFGFSIGRVFLLIGLLMLSYALFSERLISELYYVSRVFFWIIGGMFIYRMTLFDVVTKKSLMIAIGCVVLVGSISAATFILNPAEEATQNIGIYTLVWCLPFIMMMERKGFKILLMGIACFAIALSLKRGAIIAMLAAIGSYSFFSFQMKKNLRTAMSSFVVIGVSILLLIVTLYILLQVKPGFISDRFSEFSNIENTEKLGSGRGSFYSLLIDEYLKSLDSSLLNLFFGFGSRGTQELISMYHGTEFMEGAYAHSDWLQFMYDYGLLGIFIMILLHISIIKLIRKYYIMKHPYTVQLVMCYSILFLRNCYSGLFYSPQTIFFSVFVAYISALQYKNYKVVNGYNKQHSYLLK